MDVGQKATRGVRQVAQGAHRQARGTATALTHLLLPPDALNDAITANPTNPHLYLQRARASLTVAAHADAHTAKNILEEVVRDAQQAVELTQGHDQSLMEGFVLLGLALDQLGRWDEAAVAFDDAVTAHQANKKLQKDGKRSHEEETTKAKEEEGEEEAEPEASTDKQTQLQHRYVVTTFKKPTFCDHCRLLLVGLRNQGLECTECKSSLHARCSAQHKAPCRAAPDAHGLRLVDFHVPTSCAQCWLPLLGFAKQGLHCAVCRASVHERCADAFVRARPVCRAVAAARLIPRRAEAADKGLEAGHQQPSLAELQNLHGLALYHGAHYEEAIVLFTAAAAHAKEEEEEEAKGEARNLYMSVANRGLCHFYLERLDDAVADLSEAIKHGVVNEQVLSTRATAYQLLGRDDLAAADRRRAVLCDHNAVVKVFPYALPLELVVHVFSFLHEKDRAQCAQTCHLWHDLLRNTHASHSFPS